MSQAPKLFPELAGYLSSQEDVVLAILFGSVASGQARPESDADLAVAGPSLFSYERLLEISLKAGRVIGREVQVRDLRRLGGTILSQVLVKGIKLVNRDIGLMTNLITKHLDFQEDINPIFQKARIESLKKYFHG